MAILYGNKIFIFIFIFTIEMIDKFVSYLVFAIEMIAQDASIN